MLRKESKRSFEELTQEFSIIVLPSKGKKFVFVSSEAYQALFRAQKNMKDVYIVLKRAYTPRNFTDLFLRKIGGSFFTFIYPWRFSEVKQIFSDNGHFNPLGNSIDIGIYVKGNGHVRLLPWYNAFTTKKELRKILLKNKKLLSLVWKNLEAQGFVVHKNKMESLQIHIDYVGT